MRAALPSGMPIIMAILNITPDSFTDGGRFYENNRINIPAVLHQAERQINAGASILDVGGESTRPGALCISVEEECARILPVVEALKRQFPDVMISVDTRKALVAELVLQRGAEMINDVSGLQFDGDMARVVAQANAWLVLMHSIGTPETMQHLAQQSGCYPAGIIAAELAFFEQQIAYAISEGISAEKIILDPGFGFGKTVGDNMTLLDNLAAIVELGYPVLAGLSRKSFLNAGKPDLALNERDALSAKAFSKAIQQGGSMLRVHEATTCPRGVVENLGIQ